jgi:hypothetical protein
MAKERSKFFHPVLDPLERFSFSLDIPTAVTPDTRLGAGGNPW